MASKRKVSLSLDDDLVEALEEAGDNVSAQVNDAVRQVVEQRRRLASLRSMLDELEATDGPVDEAEVRRFLELLS